MQKLISVAIASPLRQVFHYALPENSTQPPLGTRVSVSFGHQKAVIGVIVESEDTNIPQNITPKVIQEVFDESTALTYEVLELCQWCARYYHYPLGEVCHLALPALLRKGVSLPPLSEEVWVLTQLGKEVNEVELGRAKKQVQAWQLIKNKKALSSEQAKAADISSTILKALKDKGIIEKVAAPEAEVPTVNTLLKSASLPLNDEQTEALARINYQGFNSYLLEGVTGSGKTEVYLQAIEKVLESNKQVLILVPEIGLTPQTLQRFEERFNAPIGTLHSGMTEKQRLQAWQKAKKGITPIVIGTRSAVFTPFPNIGLIIVDEEHDLSYKQQEGVRYSARDLAVIRAQKKSIPVILGSATPSLETLHNAREKRFTHLTLRKRATAVEMPNIQCISHHGDDISPEVIEHIRTTLSNQQQVLIFINRRGYAPTLMCQECGWISQCSNCDNRMTLHQRSTQQQYLHCHQCDTKAAKPSSCPHCHSTQLAPIGSGTQRSEESLQQYFPNTPIFRIDRDSTSRKGHLETTLETVNRGESCILIGTQMLAKGHHFSRVSLAVILGMDNGFFSSDFRGTERMGQLLTQVSGRAGREQQQGTVLIQTQFAEHPLLQQLITEGYHSLSEQLLAERQLTQMPPYQYMAMIRCHAQQATMAMEFLQHARRAIDHWQVNDKTQMDNIQCIGPLPSLIEKRNNRYYYQLQIKSTQRNRLHTVLHSLCHVLDQYRVPKGLHWLVDVDPQEA